jgi:hypothetical protein
VTTRFGNKVEVVNKSIPAAVLNAISKGNNDIADGHAAASQNPRPSERLSSSHLHDGRLPHFVERMTVLIMECSSHDKECVRVGFTSHLKDYVHHSFRLANCGSLAQPYPARGGG